MPRLVRHDRNQPYAVRKDEIKDDAIFVCACGLSEHKPFCDGSHQHTADEDPDSLYVYEARSRVRVQPKY